MIYYHETDCVNPYENLALEELLLNTAVDAPLLYLWQNSHTVVIGRNQNPWRECRLESFTTEGGRLARRLTGGGAVYHDLGNLNFTFIAPNGLSSVAKQVEVIRRAAASFDIEVVASGRNDILADGKKFSGNAFYQSSSHSLHHGTILINSDMGKLARFLAPAPEKLTSKGVTSTRNRVTNLIDLNPSITIQGMKQALHAAFEAVFADKANDFDINNINPQALEELTAHYASDAWRLGPVSHFDFAIRRRFDFGEVELHLTVSGGVIEGARAFSDAMDAPWINEVEQSLIGLNFSAAAMAQAIPISKNQKDSEALSAYLGGLRL